MTDVEPGHNIKFQIGAVLVARMALHPNVGAEKYFLKKFWSMALLGTSGELASLKSDFWRVAGLARAHVARLGAFARCASRIA